MIGKILVTAVRLAVLASMAGIAVALLASPPYPDSLLRHASNRRGDVVLGRSLTDPLGLGVQVLHADTSRLEPLANPNGFSLDMASLSPWEVEGQRQVVGVGWGRAGGADDGEGTGLAMVRMTIPGGEILDRVPLDGDPLPNGAPSWLPGTLARLIYAGSDGRIYRLDFETPRGGVDRPAEIRPRELAWEGVPGTSGTIVSDLSWDAGDTSGRRLLASIRFRNRDASGLSEWQIWWLDLDRSASKIVAAGRLLETDSASPHTRRRFPTRFLDPDGTSRLAYLATHLGKKINELRVVPVRLEPGSDIPHAREAEASSLGKGCLLCPPVVTPDRGAVTLLFEARGSVAATRADISKRSFAQN